MVIVEKLKYDVFDGSWRNWMLRLLCVMVDDLKEIMFGVFEDYENVFVFKDDFDKMNNVWMVEFRV